MTRPDISAAIERAQRDVAHVAECTVAVGLGFTGVCETEERLAALGPASVGLAVALAELGHKPEDYCQVAACPGCKALQDWADAQDGEERGKVEA